MSTEKDLAFSLYKEGLVLGRKSWGTWLGTRSCVARLKGLGGRRLVESWGRWVARSWRTWLGRKSWRMRLGRRSWGTWLRR